MGLHESFRGVQAVLQGFNRFQRGFQDYMMVSERFQTTLDVLQCNGSLRSSRIISLWEFDTN